MVRYCFFDLCSDPVEEKSEYGDERPASGKKSSRNDDLPDTGPSPASQFFSEIGRAIVEGRYSGKIDVMHFTYNERKFSFRFKPKQGQEANWKFDKASLYEMYRCKGGSLPDKAVFEEAFLSALGMLAYHPEECTPDKPANWPVDKDYEQEAELTSLYRSKKYNEGCGGAPHSKHLVCKAIDWFSIGKAQAKLAYGAAVSNAVERKHGGAVYYPATNKRTDFFHTDSGHDRGDWNDLGEDFMRKEKANFHAWQVKNNITPFTLERCITPRAGTDLVAQRNQPLSTGSTKSGPVVNVSDDVNNILKAANEIPTDLSELSTPTFQSASGPSVKVINANSSEGAQKVLKALSDLGGR